MSLRVVAASSSGTLSIAIREPPAREYSFRVVDVLECERNTVQRPAVASGRDLARCTLRIVAGPLGRHRDERIQLRIQRSDPLQKRIRQLDGRELARADEGSSFGDREVMEVGGHGQRLFFDRTAHEASCALPIIGGATLALFGCTVGELRIEQATDAVGRNNARHGDVPERFVNAHFDKHRTPGPRREFFLFFPFLRFCLGFDRRATVARDDGGERFGAPGIALK